MNQEKHEAKASQTGHISQTTKQLNSNQHSSL